MRRLLATLAAVPIAGAVAQRSADRRDRRRSPAPGRFVDVSGVTLHVVVEGAGPAVVLESGLGGSSIEWEDVAADLRRDFTVIRYDRPGLAWSPPSPCDRRPHACADRLHDLLVALGVAPPWILVGHSLGGLYVRLLASLHPDRVGALVLVDPSHEDMLDDDGTRRSAAVFATAFGMVAAAAPLGAARVAGPLYARTVASAVRRSLDEPSRARLRLSTRLTASGANGFRTVAAELAALPDGLREIRDLTALHPVPAIPLAVITAAAPARTPAEAKARATIRELHERQAAASPFGRVVLAEQSGHLVPIDEPGLVARCVREVHG